MGYLHRLARFFYGVKDSEITEADMVVPLGYGLNKDGTLPDATKKALAAAALIARRFKASIVWASANFFWDGCKEDEDRIKKEFLKKIGHEELLIVAEGINNSITEARNIRAAVIGKKIPHRQIVVVCDWPHARGAWIIWEKTFPESEIFIRSVESEKNANHLIRLARSDFGWLLACLLRHAALIIFGLDRVAKLQHPIKNSF